MSLISEAKQYIAHEIAPSLVPSLRGNFQARLTGLYRNHAELEINLVNQNKHILKTFGSNVVPQGGAVIVDDFSSCLSVADNAPPIKAYFQAWVIGISSDHTHAEISLRLVDESRKELINFGCKTIRVGQPMTVEGLEIAVKILPKEMH